MEVMEKKNRPIWVWVISIFYFLSAGYTLLSFFLIYAEVIHLEPAMKTYFDNLSIFDHALAIILGAANLIGAITLLLLRKQAFYIFSGIFCVNILVSIWHSISKGWIALLGGSGFVGAIIGWGLILAVIAYSRRLINRGILT